MSKQRLVGASWVFIIGAIFGAVLYFGVARIVNFDNDQDVSGYSYPLLAKRIQIENPNDIKVNFTGLRSEIEAYINKLPNKEAVSLYFEYLPSGVAININENSEKVAASLMKLPVVMNIYKSAELGTISLDQNITLKKEYLNSEYGTLYQKGEGYQIPVRQAAMLALKDSDNTAMLALVDLLKTSGFLERDEALNYLDINYTVTDEVAEISARSYSSVLKCVYLACYNSMADSQEMLDYLSQSTFDNRLTRFIPDSVTVAHKIGVFSTLTQNDCGIVYLENKNYILCVMVNGPDQEASQIIAELSRSIYESISNL